MGDASLHGRFPTRAAVGVLRTGGASRPDERRLLRRRRGWLAWSVVVVAVVVAAGIGAVSTLGPLKALAGLAVVLLVAAVCRWPALAAYLIVALTPLVVGISKGSVEPVVRPNEVLGVLVGVGLAAGGVARLRSGRIPRLRLDGVEWSLLLLAVCSSALPLLVMAVRRQQITRDDLLYALVMWKFLGLYVLVRLSVRTDQQVRRCLWLSVAAASVVALVAILQALKLFGVPELLSSYYRYSGNGPTAVNLRASSTVTLPAAMADLMIFNLAVVSGLWARYRRHPLILAVAAVLFVAAALAAGEFSSAIGLVVGMICIAVVTRSPRLLALFISAGLIGSGIAQAVIAGRLSGLQSPSHMPASWIGRLNNLHTYFWPKLFSHWNFVFGVRPSARVPVASASGGYVWIESGYTWLLWGGGIPLLASYVFFVIAASRRGWLAARCGAGAVSVAGAAAFVAVLVTAVLMTFDPHLTYRGSADALFVLIALAAPRRAPPQAAHPGGMPATSRIAWRGGSIVTPENEAQGTASGTSAAWRSTFSPDGDAPGPGRSAGSPAGPDHRMTGVNPAAPRRDPSAPGQLPGFLRAHLASIVAITVVVTAVAALIAGLQPREYKSQASVVAYPSGALASAETQATDMATEQALALSGAVVGAAASRLHVPERTLYAGLSISAPANSYLLNISFTDPNRRVAHRNAQAIAEAYVAYRTLPHRLPSNDGRAAFGPPVGSVQAEIVTPASLPTAPSSPNVGIDIGAGLIVGIGLGLGFALVRDRTDDRLRGAADLEAHSGAAVLALVPPVQGGSMDTGGPVVLRSPGSAPADAFRDLRTRVVQAAAWRDARSVLVASPAGEDEVPVSGNLAAALALAGRRVVLVCADPRRSRTQCLFGVTVGAGVTGVLNGAVGLADAIERTEVPGLEILPAGSGSGDLAAARQAQELQPLLDALRRRAEFVIIDAPPVLAGPESSVLAERAEMVLLAADARHSTRTGVRAAAREMEQVHGVPEGCVLVNAGRRRWLPGVLAKPPVRSRSRLSRRQLPRLPGRRLPGLPVKPPVRLRWRPSRGQLPRLPWRPLPCRRTEGDGPAPGAATSPGGREGSDSREKRW